ncbi:hypothetical protein AVL48_09760 [Amycolatopsis regifaucium]|uniref:DUF2269 domain-containing protein n=2 Tax=Amycolatopsis regifaucium TaxID=546365 RepID=A0A154MC76_9PSEU|nr:hypothetical protein AVL48_09760 [Amycolatopsis regifaucium]OKA05723.1 hypothetical protein ATP06_0221220 [Amycolatopsis regifaucium]SFG86159.1 hypothetical protein SAMN04489731_101736 [Amycolatopsis regifaucium]
MTVWLHVVTSVGWMGQALALFTLLAISRATEDGEIRVAATSMAHEIDTLLLAPLANASAFTGFMLAAGTAWGFTRHWWVLAKFVITLVQLYAGIFLLSGALQDSVAAARTGEQAPVALVAGTALMASAIAFQAWLSIAKPWGKARSGGKLPTAPTWVFVAAVAAPLADITAGLLLGFPLPALSLIVLIVQLVRRRRQLRPTPAEVPAPAL